MLNVALALTTSVCFNEKRAYFAKYNCYALMEGWIGGGGKTRRTAAGSAAACGNS